MHTAVRHSQAAYPSKVIKLAVICQSDVRISTNLPMHVLVGGQVQVKEGSELLQ